MRSILIVFFCISIVLLAKGASTNGEILDNSVPKSAHKKAGIEWIKDLSWDQIKQMAKKENKYIFVDCYATWCTPCKKMDAEVYDREFVGKFFQDKFISVKIQMDITPNDTEIIKEWYKEAERFKKEYFVFSFPTLLFFNSKGELVEKITGFQEENELIKKAQMALSPGKRYKEPYKEFYLLFDKYQKGIKEYRQFPYMISVAKKTGQRPFAQDLVNELHKYLLTQSNKELLNRDFIQFINEYEYVSGSNIANNLSRVFLKERKKVDELMQRKHYSKNALNGMIRRGYVTKFLDRVTGKGLKQFEKDSMGINLNANVPWDSLYNDISTQFNSEIAEENVLWAKIWYFDSFRDPLTLTHFISYIRKYGTEALFVDPVIRNYNINYIAWIYCVTQDADLYDTRYLSELMKGVIENSIEHANRDRRCHPYFEYIDTYAVLLYKTGDFELGRRNQQDAIAIYLHCGGGTKDDERHQIMLKQLSNMQNSLVNFSGNWVLDREKSQFNETPGKPAAVRVSVDHKDSYVTFQRDDRPKEHLKIDSTAFIEVSDPNSITKVSIKLTADKRGLIETRVYTYRQESASVVAARKTRIWMLSSDKKTLTIQEHIETTREGLNFDMQLVYERQ